MNATDYIQAGTLAAGVVSFGLLMLNRYAVANHKDRLASFTSAAGNVAGTIRGTLNKLPPGADLAAAEAALVTAAVPPLMAEFDATVAKIGGTPDKVAGIITGQLGQIPAAPIAAVVTALEPAVLSTIEAPHPAVQVMQAVASLPGASALASDALTALASPVLAALSTAAAGVGSQVVTPAAAA